MALLWVTLFVLMAAFAALAYSAHVIPYFPVDLAITEAVQAVPAPWFHSLLVAVSWPGFPPQVYIFVVLVAILFYALHRRREALYLVAASVGIAVISQGVKLLVDRRAHRRPWSVRIPGLAGTGASSAAKAAVVFGFILPWFTPMAANLLRPGFWPADDCAIGIAH
jgi:hypothetical protein